MIRRCSVLRGTGNLLGDSLGCSACGKAYFYFCDVRIQNLLRTLIVNGQWSLLSSEVTVVYSGDHHTVV